MDNDIKVLLIRVVGWSVSVGLYITQQPVCIVIAFLILLILSVHYVYTEWYSGAKKHGSTVIKMMKEGKIDVFGNIIERKEKTWKE